MGYFASMARQSGLRFSRPDVVARGAKGLRTSLPAPLDREEIVMASPSIETQIAKPGKSAPEKSLPQGTGMEMMPHVQGEGEISGTGPAPERSTAPSVRNSPPTPAAGEPSMISPAEEKKRRAGAASPGQPPVLKDYDEAPSEIERTLFVKHPQGAGATESKSAQEVEVPAAKERSDEQPGKNFFARTAEILAGRSAKPAEARTILLHEIHEWIANGPEPGAETSEKTIEFSRGAIDIEETVQMIEPEPGVVRIGVKRRAETDEDVSPQQSSGIEEQSFELSIGTISVVIEGDDRPQQTAEIKGPERSTQNTRQEMGRGPSRLSRHYI